MKLDETVQSYRDWYTRTTPSKEIRQPQSYWELIELKEMIHEMIVRISKA